MRKPARLAFAIVLFSFAVFMPFEREANADLPVIDLTNAALNDLQNTLMQNQFAQQIVVFFDQLTELENTYQEIIRFHSGIEEFIRSFIEDAASAFRLSQQSFRENYLTGFESSPEEDAMRSLGAVLEGNGDPSGIRTYIERIYGSDPQTPERAYITFDESQVGEAYLLAHEIRKRSNATKEIGESIQNQATTASPKGAGRLMADGVGKMIVLTQENQEISAKTIELQAALLEQSSRDEKRYERDRLRLVNEMTAGVESLGRPV